MCVHKVCLQIEIFTMFLIKKKYVFGKNYKLCWQIEILNKVLDVNFGIRQFIKNDKMHVHF